MIYNIQLEGSELLLMGNALDLMPHGKVRAIVDKVQAQITAQDRASKQPVADFSNGPVPEINPTEKQGE